MIKELFIDIECYSDRDLGSVGVYKYCESPAFQIILFSYSIDYKDVEVVDLASGEKIPDIIVDAIKSDDVIKYAHNSIFERVCLSKHLNLKDEYLDPKSWRCSMIWSAYNGLPFALKQIAEVLKLENKKMSEGKDLIKLFCVPDKKTNKQNTHLDYKEKWQVFKDYNKKDVEVFIDIIERLKKYPVPDFVWDEFVLDQKINDRGVMIDTDLVDSAIQIDEKISNVVNNELKKLTGLENPNSVAQLKGWLSSNGIDIESIGKGVVETLLKDNNNEQINQVLKLRLMASKSSIKKFQALENYKCLDDRVHGLFQFYGASKTGRFSSRGAQLQNLKKNNLAELESARELVKRQDMIALSYLYDDIPNVLSQLIRTAFIPKMGCKFIVSDFSAIEARVLAWFAGEKWRLDSFLKGDDIYCSAASKMFNVPVVKNGINGHLRAKGKIAELACGYGGSVGALTAMGALDMGLKECDLQPLVDAWRLANPNIVNFWYDVDKAVKNTILTREKNKVKGIVFESKSNVLFITLPSGRKLTYIRPSIDNGEIKYYGLDSAKKWSLIKTYGAKIVENIVQATARDLLTYAMATISKKYDIVMHIHDEVVVEAPIDVTTKMINELMEQKPMWAKTMPIEADGYECLFYKKE